jgi:SAM-dependent methyltransferase
MSGLNDYNTLAEKYQQTLVKPDKRFSILPTILMIAGDVTDKTVLDLGCGSGFFSGEFANRGAKKVIGMDNSVEQIRIAKKIPLERAEYVLGDIFKDKLPSANLVLAAYVLNYAADAKQLANFFRSIYRSLRQNGKFIAVVDLPEGRDLKKFGAVKKVLGEKVDGAKIEIKLFNEGRFICALNAVYFTPQTLENALRSAGFKDVIWHKSIISDEGIKKFGAEFWKDYLESPELGYVSAMKG